MQVPRVRFTVRRMMVAVAIAGFILGGYVAADALIKKSRKYRDKWGRAAFDELLCSRNFDASIKEVATLREFADTKWSMAKEAESEGMRRIIKEDARRWEYEHNNAVRQLNLFRLQRDYFAARKLKYEGAAARPWLPVEPDPPQPK